MCLNVYYVYDYYCVFVFLSEYVVYDEYKVCLYFLGYIFCGLRMI